MRLRTILHVEDDPNDAFFVRLAFERAGLGANLVRVADGQEAVDYLGGRGQYSDRTKWPVPALLLLDLKMPVLDGFDVLGWLRAQPEFHRLPILILTSSDAEEDMRRAKKLGATDYLVKSSNWATVVERVRGLVDLDLPGGPPPSSGTGQQLGNGDVET